MKTNAIKMIILVLIIGAITTNMPGCGKNNSKKPAILITYPAPEFLKSLMYLQKKGLMPESRYVFLLHKKMLVAHKAIIDFFKANNYPDYEIMTLSGYPHNNYFQKIVLKHNNIYPDKEEPRFITLKKRIHYLKWKKTFREAINKTDALFIPGGRNIPASFYGQRQYIPAVNPTPIRSLYELNLLEFLLKGKKAYLQKKPGYLVAGFCLGAQTLNVAMGGDLYQSITLEVYNYTYIDQVLKGNPDLMHTNFHLVKYPTLNEIYNGWFHKIKIDNSCPFFTTTKNVYLLSNHQQAAKRLGENLVVIATSIDGKTPEIIKHRVFKNVIGFQGHVESYFALERIKNFPKETEKFHNEVWAYMRQVILSNFQQRTKNKTLQ